MQNVLYIFWIEVHFNCLTDLIKPPSYYFIKTIQKCLYLKVNYIFGYICVIRLPYKQYFFGFRKILIHFQKY